MKKELDDILKKYKRPVSVVNRKPYLIDYLVKIVPYQTNSISELIFLYQNPNFNPICDLGNKRKFFEGKYLFGCGGNCACSINQAKITLMKKYGVDNPSKSLDIQLKKIETNLKKYGVKNPSQSSVVKEKTRKTNLEKYGVENPNQADEIKQRKIQTFLKKYGETSPLKSNDIREKIKCTNLKKYGYTTSLKNDLVKCKKIATLEQRYNVCHPKQIHIPKEVMKKYNSRDWLFDQHVNQKKSCEQISRELGVGPSLVCTKMRQFSISIQNFTSSSLENEIVNFINGLSLTTKIVRNDRLTLSNLELDIVIPEKNIAIEMCGLYWHSEIGAGKTYDYHKNKLQSCLNKNIKLITIFSDEWQFKKDIVKLRLKHLLGANERLCTARQTKVYPIECKLYQQFVNHYHIQGYVASKIKLGAFFGDELVAVMGLGARRRNLGVKNQDIHEYEMLRFCTKGSVPGVGSKLFCHFKKLYNPTSVVSYADRRWGEGEFYSNLGFEFVKSTSPSYFYTKDYQKRHNRFAFRKDVIVRELGGDPKLTEWQNMQNMGYDRIWDCGTNKWIWKR